MANNQYFQDFDTFLTHSALRQKLYYNQKVINKTPKHVIATRTRQRQQAPVYDFQNDESVIIAIHNDQKFMNVIMNSKHQKVLLAYIFVEYEYGYITCILKNPEGFPIMIMKIPIDKKFAYAKNVNNACYEFPISDLVSKDIKYNKTCSYLMMFRHNEQKVQFIYDIYNGNSKPNRITIDDIPVNNKNVIDNLLCVYDIGAANQNIAYNNANDVGNYILFNNMSIKLLAEIHPSNAIMFTGKSITKTKTYFMIDNDDLLYVTENNKKRNDVHICTKGSPNIIYWDDINLDNLKIEMYNYENLFKINYTKSIMSNDRVYYVLTMFMNNYIFMKIATPLEIAEDTVIDSFIKLFSHDYQIMECYMCHQVQ